MNKFLEVLKAVHARYTYLQMFLFYFFTPFNVRDFAISGKYGRILKTVLRDIPCLKK